MKLKTLVVLSFLLLASAGIANANTPVNGAFYAVDLSPIGYCDFFEFYTYGPSQPSADLYNFTTGFHDLTTGCDLGIVFPFGGFEVRMQKGQPPNDCDFGSCENAVDIEGSDFGWAYEYDLPYAVATVFDLLGKGKHQPPSVAVYIYDDYLVDIAIEGPVEIDAYTEVAAAEVKKNAANHPARGLPSVGSALSGKLPQFSQK